MITSRSRPKRDARQRLGLNGDDLIRAGIVAGRGRTHALRVAIYDRTGGVLQRVIQADRAMPDPRAGDWRLKDVRIYDANMNVVRDMPANDGDGRRHAGPADAGQGRSRPSSIIGR